MTIRTRPLMGTLTNNGTLTFGNNGDGVNLHLAGSVTLNGNGTVTLNNRSNNLLFANTAGDRLTIGANQTIQGSGNLGNGQTTFTNNGTVIANQATTLIIQPGGGNDFTNTGSGILEASAGGTLQLNGAGGATFVNNNIVRALNGSFVDIANGATVTGTGIYSTAGTGLIRVINSTLSNLTFTGNLSLADNTNDTLVGTLTNNGTLSFDNNGNGINLRLSGNVTLAGTGLISLNNRSNNLLFANTAGDRLTIGSQSDDSRQRQPWKRANHFHEQRHDHRQSTDSAHHPTGRGNGGFHQQRERHFASGRWDLATSRGQAEASSLTTA